MNGCSHNPPRHSYSIRMSDQSRSLSEPESLLWQKVNIIRGQVDVAGFKILVAEERFIGILKREGLLL
jgi:hypothetical protein